MKTFLRSLPAALLILLFIYAAASKLISVTDFRGQLYNQTFPHWLADILLYLLPVAEILAVILLLFYRTQLAGLILSLDLLLSFTGYIALVVLHFWGRVPCSCGGILNKMSWPAHLVFNCIFILIAITAIILHMNDKKGAAENLRTE